MATTGKSETAELKFRIPRSLLEKLNNYRHEHQHDSRTDAILALLRRGLESETANADQPPAKEA